MEIRVSIILVGETPAPKTLVIYKSRFANSGQSVTGYNNSVSVTSGFGNKGTGLFSGFMSGFGNTGFLQSGFGNLEANPDNNSATSGFGNSGKQDSGGFNSIDFVSGFFHR